MATEPEGSGPSSGETPVITLCLGCPCFNSLDDSCNLDSTVVNLPLVESGWVPHSEDCKLRSVRWTSRRGNKRSYNPSKVDDRERGLTPDEIEMVRKA
jgi:hypothetical protein